MRRLAVMWLSVVILGVCMGAAYGLAYHTHATLFAMGLTSAVIAFAWLSAWAYDVVVGSDDA